MLLSLGFKSLYCLADNFGTFCHVRIELEGLFELSFLVELHVPGLEEMSLDGYLSLDLVFIDFPLGDPLACVKLANANILGSKPNIHIQTLFANLRKT